MTVKETAEFFEKKDLKPPKKKRKGWKVIAIILIILFVLIIAWIGWGSLNYEKDLVRAEQCSDLCRGDYHGWGYENHNCTCYYYNFPINEPIDYNKEYKLIPAYSKIIP